MKKFLYILIAISATQAFAAPKSKNTPSTGLPDVSPVAQGQYVAINIPQQRLFLYTNGKLTKIYPVAVGKAQTQTNLGEHKIGVKAFNPTWHIPLSIQKELKDGRKTVPPGPKNPLGPVFVRMGDPKLGLGIHGTNAPASVPGVRSHGCVRMKSPDALEFAKTITTGTTVNVTYQMASLNADANNNLWLAAYRDPYNKRNLDTAALQKSINSWAKAHGKTVNSKRVAAILKARTGALNCITCSKGQTKIHGSLQSLAWLSGKGSLSKARSIPAPDTSMIDEIAPDDTGIEVDASDAPISDTDDFPKEIMPLQDLSPTNQSASQLPIDKLF